MEMKGREAELEVFLGDGSTGEEEETGDGVIEGRLEGFEVFGVTEEQWSTRFVRVWTVTVECQ